ncbi:hypothetical protein V565_027980 [Rhizoctonia solani 123E]|uniref:Uncharacterized protein n=1 Tax=Rhizoctonia solani 123E TaxID=1423351 RepID=A0A074S9P6_9AGAM|nr:hypothetical protein V565_027980 [Rhizoctonia solani 123E]
MLSTIPSTPTFSIITVLDLSNCDDLHDSNISQLKILTSLCVLDTSCTHLTDQAIRNLMSTLLLQEPGPLRLQSWSLRNCVGVTNRSLESLGYFPMLCLLDLRGTKVEPHQSMHRLLNWNRSCVLSAQEHFDFFWPQPQVGIPAQIQDLKPSAYSIVEGGDKPENERQRPWIIHIDRQYPSDWGLHRKPHWKPPPSNTLPWYSYDYSDGYSDNDSDIDMFEADGLFIDGDNFDNGLDSGDSFDEAETELSPSESGPSSPLEPTPSIFGDDETLTSPRLDPASMTTGATNAASPGNSGINAAETQSTSRSIVPTIAPQPTPTDLNQLMALIVGHESASPAPGVPHFYNARVQAELAPPKARKRRRRYSSASSESYDSDEEREKEKKMEDELQRRRMEAISDKDWQRMLLRQPPEWSEAETLITTVRALKQYRSGDVPAQPDLSTAKKRKVGTSEAAARWAQMKASSKGPSQVPSQSTVPQQINTIGLRTSSQIRPPVTQISTPTPTDRAPVRRTTLGRAPRPPGSIVRKPR